MTTSAGLPRLLYLGDVPVEASYHGSALLYRLLQHYPPDRLSIIEAGIEASKPERRLPGVSYHGRRLPLSRLQTTRFAPWYQTACLRAAAWRSRFLQGLARAARPEAILTVTHGYSWLAAAELARQLQVPLHLVCHDEWSRTGTVQDWKDKVFRRYYASAASRLCVSPFMVEEYARRYGVGGTLLYPSRAADAVTYAAPPARLAAAAAPFTCAFAGTINSPGMAALLRLLAHRLLPLRGRLLIYGPLTPEAARASGLAAENIEIGGLWPSATLMEKLRERVDVLFVPMSFAVSDRNNMEISFPSKLTDYTAVGLPLLICGPAYCSAVRWAIENSGVAEVVMEQSSDALAASLARLVEDPGYRLALAERALAVGESDFSHRSASVTFHCAIAVGSRDHVQDSAGDRNLPNGVAAIR